MSSRDQKVLTNLVSKLGVEPQAVKFDTKGHLVKLDLSDSGLTKLPSEIGQFAYLSELNLRDNNFSIFPSGIVQLSSLNKLDLWNNRLMWWNR